MKEDWKEIVWDFLQTNKMQELKKWIMNRSKDSNIFPEPKDWLQALDLTSFKNTKVIIIGQDPYHGKGQAHGLAFSVREGTPIPPSLRNIFLELKNDLGWQKLPSQGFLTSWAKEGVLLLNNVLTVEEGKPGSHQGKGWEEFTDKIIEELNKRKRNLVFILWGKQAQEKGKRIDKRKHLVLESAHPSPLSARRGFFGSKPFSKCNEYLVSYGIKPVNWQL